MVDGQRCSTTDVARSTTYVSIAEDMNNVVTVLFQNHESHFFRDRLDLSSINYKKNVGHVLEAALLAIGLRWHPSGKCIWWAAEPNGEKLQWLEPAKIGSRAPKPQTQSARRRRGTSGRRASSATSTAATTPTAAPTLSACSSQQDTSSRRR